MQQQLDWVKGWPDHIKPGTTNDDMLSMIDISATILDIAGVKLPSYLDGHPILGPKAKKRDHIFAAHDLILASSLLV